MPTAAAPGLPFLTAYDPPGTSEGTLDPMGLYQIADQLAVDLVPAVRERMQRIRFLSAIAVGALVTETVDFDPARADGAPYLAWEWLVIEAMLRTFPTDDELVGVPGVRVGRSALRNHGYLDARSYLKTPSVFGFNGVYKRLAFHLGIVDVHLGPGPQAEAVADGWARSRGFNGLREARETLAKWTRAVQRSLDERPAKTKPGWSISDWAELGEAFLPNGARAREKQALRELLHVEDHRRLGALPAIWELQREIGDETEERELHDRLGKRAPQFGPKLAAIRAYEEFARSLQDGFDLLRAEAARPDASGYPVAGIAKDREFKAAVAGLAGRFERAHRALGEVAIAGRGVQAHFDEQFSEFAAPMDPASCAHALCQHHEKVQRAKSVEGKRPWFDRLSADRIFLRHDYRIPRPEPAPERYVHGYRGAPIRRFHRDLT